MTLSKSTHCVSKGTQQLPRLWYTKQYVLLVICFIFTTQKNRQYYTLKNQNNIISTPTTSFKCCKCHNLVVLLGETNFWGRIEAAIIFTRKFGQL